VNAPAFPTRGFGGVPLKGNKIVRLVYLDEAGISNPEHEPYLVVAGVIVNPDRQWKELEAYFRDLAYQLFPDADPYRFVFHAKDIFHGSGPFDRKTWSRKERMKIMGQLAQVPRLFALPIVMGELDRIKADQEVRRLSPDTTKKSRHNFIHTHAFINAIQRVQYWMEKNAPEETAMLIAEDTPEMKSTLKNVHEGYTDKTRQDDEAFRAPNIIDAVHFAQKKDSLLLQIADHCAFIIKRKLMGKSDVNEFYDAISPYIQRDFKPAKGFVVTVHASQLRWGSDPAEAAKLRGG